MLDVTIILMCHCKINVIVRDCQSDFEITSNYNISFTIQKRYV